MSGDNAFFEELQMDFLNESAFMLEQYEEYMMTLENSQDPAKDLADIFRVAHSVKGGAAAVGLTDLSRFAHVMEDLLDLLRSQPVLVSSDVITLLLESGDKLKSRISSLQQGQNSPWDTAELEQKLVNLTESLSSNESIDINESENVQAPEEIKLAVPDDFFSTAGTSESNPENDVTNHELLAELLSQLSPEERREYQAEAAVPVVKTEKAPVSANPVSNNVAAKSNSKMPTASIKVDTGRVDSVLDAVGELVVLKNQLVHDETVRSGTNLRLEGIVDQLDKAIRELYEKTLSIRMTPLKSMFIKIQRIVRDVSLSLDKTVDLQLIGENTEVERTVFELLGDPLVHIVRNSMDHGIEKKELRLERGKPATAKVVVSAKQSGGNVTIDISDDGGGINRDKVLTKAIEKGLVADGVDPSALSDEQVFQYLFQPGFSTAEKISDLSGRGVGLDVVKSNLDKIHGKINIYSKPAQGTTFRLTIPLSTAITEGIIVMIAGIRYILPIHSIREIIRVWPNDYTIISGAGRVANIRGALLPVIDVSSFLGSIANTRREESMLVIIETMTGQMAFPVDDVLGQAQVVVKPISTGQNIPEIAGAAILGDGKTVLILDPGALVNNISSYSYEIAI